ncbi:MAG: TetR/AcrR family transcriptional regulator [Chloroflexi bacterium]|nr:TetR/AcrR family transcriptional regulator [Chloroflexota bacterium]
MTAPAIPGSAGRPGRQIDTERTRAILDGVLELLREIGYEQLTIDGLAARAHVSKATIYRRWQNKAEMVVAALDRWHEATHSAPVDTGSLRGDLLARLGTIRDEISGPDGALLNGVLHAMQADAELAGVMRRRVPGDDTDRIILRRAIDRGDVPPTLDLNLLSEVAAAQMFSRTAIIGLPADDAYLAHLVDDILLPILTRRPLERIERWESAPSRN